jgi:hypothetical protein
VLEVLDVPDVSEGSERVPRLIQELQDCSLEDAREEESSYSDEGYVSARMSAARAQGRRMVEVVSEETFDEEGA